MGVLINHSKGTKIVLSRNIKCLAKPITEILSSDSWEDKRCILMGGGPSIVDFDFSLIENELTIGVNKSFIKFPTNIVYCMDMGFYDKVSHDHPKNSKLKKLHQQWLEDRKSVV